MKSDVRNAGAEGNRGGGGCCGGGVGVGEGGSARRKRTEVISSEGGRETIIIHLKTGMHEEEEEEGDYVARCVTACYSLMCSASLTSIGSSLMLTLDRMTRSVCSRLIGSVAAAVVATPSTTVG